MEWLIAKRFIKEKLLGITLAQHTVPVNNGVLNIGVPDASLFQWH